MIDLLTYGIDTKGEKEKKRTNLSQPIRKTLLQSSGISTGNSRQSATDLAGQVDTGAEVAGRWESLDEGSVLFQD